MAFKYFVLIAISCAQICLSGDVCPKECDCDMDNGLNRAICVDQNIIGIDVGVPKAVQVYSLSHNMISELDNFCFKEVGYTSLQVLNLSYNFIFWIGLHAFSGLDKLVYIDLSNNRLRYILSDLFWDTPLLETVNLAGNVFETLKNEPFLMHSKLQVLNLNNCRIKSLPNRLFTRMPNLKKLDLSENYIMSLNIDVLRPLRKLTRLELRNEYWKCDDEFMKTENWIASCGITYENQCKKTLPKMFEKMISTVEVENNRDIDINQVWNSTDNKNDLKPTLEANETLTLFQKFDQEFPAFQSFIIGLEIGLAIGIVGTYIWLRKFCKCGQLNCIRPQTRRQRRRARRIADTDMRTNLLWNTVTDLETPPSFRRQLLLPDRSPPTVTYGLIRTRDADLNVDAIRLPDRAETPPPPYNECRMNI